MALQYSGFPNCCGAGIIWGFYNSNNLNHKTYPEYRRETEREFREMFAEVPPANTRRAYLRNVGMVYAILNEHQMENEQFLLEYGFTRMGEVTNKNSNNNIVSYIRFNREVVKKGKAVPLSMFNDGHTPVYHVPPTIMRVA